MSKIDNRKNFEDKLRAGLDYWLDPKHEEEIRKYCAEQRKIKEIKIAEGYILECNGVYYTEQDILDGKCPANGILVNMGYVRDGNKWRKKLENIK